jgi:hypothetical protein
LTRAVNRGNESNIKTARRQKKKPHADRRKTKKFTGFNTISKNHRKSLGIICPIRRDIAYLSVEVFDKIQDAWVIRDGGCLNSTRGL